MDVLKLSADSHAKISDLGDLFHLNLIMGELAHNTYNDIAQLANAVHRSLEQYTDRGFTDEQIGKALQLDGDVHLAMDEVFARFVMTVDQYAQMGAEQSEAALEYITSVGQVVKLMEGIFLDLQLNELFSQAVSHYGQGAKNYLDLRGFLDNRYKAQIISASEPKLPTRRHQTADYTSESSPREYVARAFAKIHDGTVTKTLVGIANRPAEPEEPSARDLPNPMVMVAYESIDIDEPPVVRRNTELGIGQRLESKDGFIGPVVEIPRHSPPPRIDVSNTNGMEDLDDEPTITMGAEELLAQAEASIREMEDEPEEEEITRVSSTFTVPYSSTGVAQAVGEHIVAEHGQPENNNKEENAPPIPPAPAMVEPSTRRTKLQSDHKEIFDPPPSSRPGMQTALPEAVATAPATPAIPDVVVPAPAAATVSKEAGPRTVAETIPDTENSNRSEAFAPRVITPAQSPKVTHLPKIMVGAQQGTGQAEQRTAAKMEPIAPPQDLQLPSSYRPGPSRPETRQEETLVNRKVVNTPTAVTAKTRSKVWKWAAAAATAAGLAGIFGAVYVSGNQETDSTESKSASSATNSSTPQTPEQKDLSTPDQDNKVERQTADQGVYRMDTSHPAFSAYLCKIKQATGLVSRVKSSAANAKVPYYADSAAREQAKERYQHVLSGNETEEQQRIAMMKVFVDNAMESSVDNSWLVSFFKKQKAGIEEYENTGSWSNKALSVGTDKLYSAIQKPEKLTTSPNIIGYAPDVNPDTNPVILKVKAGAPTFYQILKEVGTKMRASTNPEDLAPYDDFKSIQEVTCKKILQAGRASKDADTRSGISYMHSHWCKDDCAQDNPLSRALRQTVPVLAETPVAPVAPNLSPAPSQSTPGPQISPTPNNTAPTVPSVNVPPAHTRLEEPVQQQRHATLEKKPGFFGKAASKVKSFFGFGKKEVPVETQTAAVFTPESTTEPVYTKEDIPMYTWKETLKQYFWG